MCPLKKKVSVLFICLLAVFPVFAQESYNITEAGNIFDYWDGINDYCVQSNYAYLISEYDGLYIYDISDPTNPDLVSNLYDQHGVRVSTNGNYAFVLNRIFSDIPFLLDVLDISEATSPENVGSYPVSMYVDDIVCNESTVFLLLADESIISFDITNPATPTPLDTLNLGATNSLCLDGDYLYLAVDNGNDNTLHILDISNSAEMSSIGSASTGNRLFDFDLAETTYNNNTVCSVVNSTLYIWNVTDPSNPAFESQSTIATVDDHSIVLHDDILYVVCYLGFNSYNISNSEQPTHLEAYNPEEIISEDLLFIDKCQIANNNLIVLYNGPGRIQSKGFAILDISDPENISEISCGDHFEILYDIVLSDDYLFTCGSKVQIVDVQDPENPTMVSEIDRVFARLEVTSEYLLGLTYGFMTDQNDSLFFYDISNINSPILINQIDVDSGFEFSNPTISLSGNILYIGQSTTNESELKFYDFSNPSEITAPELVGSIPAPDGGNYSYNDAILYENYLYLTGYFGEYDLRIYELDNSQSPWTLTLINEMTIQELEGEGIYDIITITEDHLVMSSWSSYTVFDISDRVNPSRVYTKIGTDAHALSFKDDHIFKIEDDRFAIVDISDPSNPWVSGYYSSFKYPDSYCFDDNNIYLSLGSRVKALEYAEAMGVEDLQSSTAPVDYQLIKAYPNPFNPTLNIRVSLPETGVLKLTVHNVLGQEVAVLSDRTLERGYHNFTFDGSNLSSGVYFVKAVVEGKMNDVQKVMLMK